MKTPLTFFFLIFLITGTLSGQDANYGIYMNWQDYKSGKLSCVVNPKVSKGKLKLHHFFSKDYMEVVRDGVKYRFCKDSIYGYRDSQRKNFRFYKNNDKEYQILENEEIVIYLDNVPEAYSNGKNIHLVPAYYFSKSLNSEIIPLTVLNLKRAFPDDLKFHDILDLTFGDGTPISSYNTKQKMYEINYIMLKEANILSKVK